MTALSIGNPGNLVTRTINQSKSKDLMLRELFQNALEATSKQTFGKKKIHIRITDPSWFGIQEYYSTKKFGIFNTGPGMNARNLRKATDLSSSIGKIQGVHNNFGEGAKVSALPVNKAGMIWVSCHNKEVNMVVLRLGIDPLTKEERYERQDFPNGYGGTSDVVNITPIFDNQEAIIAQFGGTFSNPSGLDTEEDWTYITLCGNDRDQDTTQNPYGTEKKMTGAWAINEIYKRFSFIPSDVEIRSEINSRISDGAVSFKTVFEMLKDKASKYPNKVQLETISIPVTANQVDITDYVQNGTINITYVYDGPYELGIHSANVEKPTSVIGNSATCPIFSGIIYKDEFYDVRGGNEGVSTWQVPAKECGILYGFKYFRVFVHIPTSDDIVTDRYRVDLTTNTFDKKKIVFTDYKHQIYNNMPDWFKDKMKQFAPKPMNLDDVQQELQDLMEKVKLQISAEKITTSSSGSKTTLRINKNPTNNTGGGHGSTNTGATLGSALMPSLFGKQKILQQFPKIEVLSAKDISGSSVSPKFQYKAGEYALDQNILFINATYPAVLMIKEDLLNGYLNLTEETEKLAEETSISLVSKLVGTGLVYGLAKQGKTGYDDSDFEKAIDPACLSTHADRWIEYINEARKRFEKDLKVLELKNPSLQVA